MVRKYTLYDFYCFKFVKVCFMVQNVTYFEECFMWAWEECVFCSCWMKHSITVKEINLVNNAVQVIHILIDILPVWTVKRVFKISIYNSGWELSVPHLSSCLLLFDILLLGAYAFRIVVFPENWPLHDSAISLFTPDNPPCSKVWFV